MKTFLATLALVATPLWAQSFGLTEDDQTPLPDFSNQETIDGGITVETLEVGRGEVVGLNGPGAVAQRATAAPGAVLRGLDKVSGEVTDMELTVGDSRNFGRLTVALEDCRYPVDNPSGDAFALLTVQSEGLERPAFEGWMVASSPALSALDHPRYDVWVIRCKTS